jgi:uncharacterized spore protein YtfJ
MIAEPTTKPLDVAPAERLLDRLAEATKIDAVFGQPIERDGVTLITCSEQAIGLGGGFSPAKPTDSPKKAGENEGIGGGAGARGRPIAVVVLTRDGVKVKPIVNVTRVLFAQAVMVGFAFLLVSRLLRHNRRLLKMRLAKPRDARSHSTK